MPSPDSPAPKNRGFPRHRCAEGSPFLLDITIGLAFRVSPPGVLLGRDENFPNPASGCGSRGLGGLDATGRRVSDCCRGRPQPLEALPLLVDFPQVRSVLPQRVAHRIQGDTPVVHRGQVVRGGVPAVLSAPLSELRARAAARPVTIAEPRVAIEPTAAPSSAARPASMAPMSRPWSAGISSGCRTRPPSTDDAAVLPSGPRIRRGGRRPAPVRPPTGRSPRSRSAPTPRHRSQPRRAPPPGGRPDGRHPYRRRHRPDHPSRLRRPLGLCRTGTPGPDHGSADPGRELGDAGGLLLVAAVATIATLTDGYASVALLLAVDPLLVLASGIRSAPVAEDPAARCPARRQGSDVGRGRTLSGFETACRAVIPPATVTLLAQG